MMVINDILSKKQRKDLLELCKPLVKNTSGVPAKQSDPFLHLNPSVRKYIEIFNKKISNGLSKQIYFQKVWVNEDMGYKRDVYWHNHQYELAAVYYLKTIPLVNSGTLFQDKFVRCKQNSILLFPGYLMHGTPSYPFHWIKRYSIAMEINIRR